MYDPLYAAFLQRGAENYGSHRDRTDICCKNPDRSEAASGSNCGNAPERFVELTTGHNHFSIAHVWQTSDVIQIHIIVLFRVLYR
jgi:hypothetical protein